MVAESPSLLPLLKQFFGFSNFRPLQAEIIRDALAGRGAVPSGVVSNPLLPASPVPASPSVPSEPAGALSPGASPQVMAPALANALAALNGAAVRALPMSTQGLTFT